ncbi:hypothetical protein BT63DRAFT_418067 [Microthyrium microscopicum]|uniref:Uncharacterized protein n=1 Tax=Microthyrium microscopicum TaxID=703497 RepID=A0A6A6TY24_9PEZI|nr:hypothetical protein BT63DRAFT_418067 [Microthyrium microscopicum]
MQETKDSILRTLFATHRRGSTSYPINTGGVALPIDDSLCEQEEETDMATACRSHCKSILHSEIHPSALPSTETLKKWKLSPAFPTRMPESPVDLVQEISEYSTPDVRFLVNLKTLYSKLWTACNKIEELNDPQADDSVIVTTFLRTLKHAKDSIILARRLLTEATPPARVIIYTIPHPDATKIWDTDNFSSPICRSNNGELYNIAGDYITSLKKFQQVSD